MGCNNEVLYNDEVWKDVKGGKYLGFSIEGFFSDQLNDVTEESENEELVKVIN